MKNTSVSQHLGDLCSGLFSDFRANVWKGNLAFAYSLGCEEQARSPVVSTSSWKAQLDFI